MVMSFILNLIKLEVIPGYMTDPQVCGFDFTMTFLNPLTLDFELNFENPFEISQNNPPERVKLTILDYPDAEI